MPAPSPHRFPKPPPLPVCDNCGYAFIEGEVAWEVPMHNISIRGGTVTHTDTMILICEECHDG